MDDLYQTLIGPPPGINQHSAVADQLRRRRSFGELGAISGDPVLQPFGKGQVAESDQYAKQLQDTRQKDIDNSQTQQYQTAQLNHMKTLTDLEKRGQDLDHIFKMMMAEAALEKADKTGMQKPQKLTYADRTKLENMSSMVNAVRYLML